MEEETVEQGLEDNEESSRQRWKRKEMCEGLGVCPGEWHAALCSWSSENERGAVGEEAELVGVGSSCTASCESHSTCSAGILQGYLHICSHSVYAPPYYLSPYGPQFPRL